ncbi:MAG: TetR/AcrR family transcriptional regulator [Acidimicrobiales bacterium]
MATTPRAAARRPGTDRDGRAARVVHHLGTDDRSSTRVRVVDAALRCLARHGAQRTTVDEIAHEARVSRATLYRTFPGGKDAVLGAVVETEAARLFSAVAVAMGEASDLEDVLVAGMVEAARRLSSHPALGYLLEHEPGTVLPHLAFAEMDRLLAAAAELTAPFFGRWLEPEQAVRAAEWAVRIVMSYLTCPAEGSDLTDPAQARHLVGTFVIPGIQALRMAGTGPLPPTAKPPAAAGHRRPPLVAADGRTW